MEHGLELFIPILEILEIGVFNVLQNPGNIGKRNFSIQSYPGNIGKRIFSIFSYPGNIGKRIFSMLSYPGNIENGFALFSHIPLNKMSLWLISGCQPENARFWG